MLYTTNIKQTIFHSRWRSIVPSDLPLTFSHFYNQRPHSSFTAVCHTCFGTLLGLSKIYFTDFSIFKISEQCFYRVGAYKDTVWYGERVRFRMLGVFEFLKIQVWGCQTMKPLLFNILQCCELWFAKFISNSIQSRHISVLIQPGWVTL